MTRSSRRQPRTVFFAIALWLAVFPAASFAQSSGSLLSYVDPLVGTAASTTAASLRHGAGTEQLANTIPAVGVPFGMTQWTPQTRTSEQKCLAPYYYKDDRLNGFRGTHWLSGSCTQDYGSVTLMPVAGHLTTKKEDYAVHFSHSEEIAAPDYYRLSPASTPVTTEITALARCGFFRFTLRRNDSLYILVMPNSDQHKGFIKINPARKEITGYNPAYRIYQGWGQPAGFSGYFVIEADKGFGQKGVFSDGTLFSTDSIRDRPDEGAYIGFALKKGETLRLRIGTSFTSIEEARKNLKAEIPGWDFDALRRQNAAAWEKALGKIRVSSQSERLQKIFYTAFYHSMQHPRMLNDADGHYPIFAHQYATGKLKKGNYYDDFSMWDIYRAQLPLFEILAPTLINDCVRSLILKGQEGGWLPIFPCWNSYTGAMIGDHGTAFIASAFMKGIRDYDMSEAYRLMRQNAFDSPDPAAYADGKGRRALRSYLRYSYIPLEDSVPEAFHKKEQVSRTLEYAYDDYALAMVAKELHKKEDYRKLIRRAFNYRQVFDSTTGFVRGRFADGSWVTPFDPDTRSFFITEGTPRQYSFYVPQDIPGLAKLMGGRDALETALDSLFAKGEYWHGNEPGHQIPFLYNYTAAPWKTQDAVRNILADEYDEGPGGLSGNDDAGQMSAWYVFGAIGLYPVDPVSGNFAICTPLFDKVRLQLPDGKKLRINTHAANKNDLYIASVQWNGHPWQDNYIPYAVLEKGGVLDIRLQEKPGSKWGVLRRYQPGGLNGK